MTQPSNEPIAGGEPSPTRADPFRDLPGPRPAPWWAWALLGFLFLANVLAAVDHWLFTALTLPLGRELELWDDQADWLETLPLIAAALWAPTLGYFADHVRRPRLLALGIAVFGLASVATALATSFEPLQRARALVGVGTATFGVVALTILMDLFPRTVRARVLAIYFLAGPVGAAAALNFGPALAVATTWHTAFLIAGAPALVLALASLALPDPVRGVSEGTPVPRLRLHEARGARGEDYVDLMVNSSFTYAVFGLTFTGFAIGGLTAWLPTFLTGVRGFTGPQATILTATIPPAAAAVGLLAGAWLADLWGRTDPRAYFLVPALAASLALPLWLATALGPARPWQFGVLFATIALLFANLGPCYAIVAAVAAPNMRGVACGSALAVSHLLGDVWSPRLMAWGAEVFGQPDAMATSFGKALATLGATPRVVGGRPAENVAAALLFAAPTLAAAGFVLLAGARHLPRESALMLANLRAAPPPAGAARVATPPGP
ncbi:MFS transporter [Paludisphaera mucosa]|uniref:MFS transporter n=1 Tax=Paludisphaera mucosa TaxID=3030827 RepID=A0ABT6FIC7_9BACT|nr:MFS transporter [Paludisphaera mucosa]